MPMSWLFDAVSQAARLAGDRGVKRPGRRKSAGAERTVRRRWVVGSGVSCYHDAIPGTHTYLYARTPTHEQTSMHTHLTTAQVLELSAKAETLGLSEKARERLTWITHFLTHDQSMVDTCVAFGVSRSTFRRWLERFDPQDLLALEEKSHEPMTVRQPAVPSEVVAQIRAFRERSPLMGKERIAELLRERGADVSASTVGRVIERECLYFADTPLHWKKRLRGAEATQASMLLQAMQGGVLQNAVTSSMGESIPAPAQPASEHAPLHDCLLCRASRRDWRAVKRSVFVASVITNVAVIAMFALSALWEGKQTSLQATVSSLELGTLSSSLSRE